MSARPKNLTASIEDGFLILKIPMNPTPLRSATGKTLVVASTHGNKETEVRVEGQSVFVGVNAYIYPGK